MISCDVFLMGYRNALANIDDIQIDINAMRERLESITPSYSDMPGGGDSIDSRNVKLAKLADLTSKRDSLIIQSNERLERIRSFVNLISDKHKRESRYLEYYYCDLFTNQQIASVLHVTERRVYQIRDDALRLAEKYYMKYRP